MVSSDEEDPIFFSRTSSAILIAMGRARSMLAIRSTTSTLVSWDRFAMIFDACSGVA